LQFVLSDMLDAEKPTAANIFTDLWGREADYDAKCLGWVQIGRTAPVLQRGNAGARSDWTSIYTTAHH
jgi:hypothetical protein